MLYVIDWFRLLVISVQIALMMAAQAKHSVTNNIIVVRLNTIFCFIIFITLLLFFIIIICFIFIKKILVNLSMYNLNKILVNTTKYIYVTTNCYYYRFSSRNPLRNGRSYCRTSYGIASETTCSTTSIIRLLRALLRPSARLSRISGLGSGQMAVCPRWPFPPVVPRWPKPFLPSWPNRMRPATSFFTRSKWPSWRKLYRGTRGSRR